MQTIYVVETYEDGGGEMWPVRAVICRDDADARSRARLLAAGVAGVIAYSQRVDSDSGDCAAPVVLARYGRTPAEPVAA